MQIHGTTQVHGPQSINAPHAPRFDALEQTTRAGATTDTVDISETGRLLELASQLPEVRADRVNQIRAELVQGRYDTADKLDVAVERLLDEIA
ncbi:MAG: flagellar biosynthesis anti-sigma factor FlgM [Planctomycetia bacterium]|nr:flagellar biosynthesis anti-sigma factor FlgM [Planctomycetia bacterium]